MHVGLVLADRYEIVRPLAAGAMSTVWVARDRTEQQDVAIKAISLDAAGWRAEVRDRFMKEARILAHCKHEHLVGVRDVGETEDGFLYLVLDLLEGETLAARLTRETKIPWRQASTLAIRIARGAGALHRAGVVHRDLKPANIVLHETSGGVVPKIIDLGIGKAASDVGDPALSATLTATGQVLGTPQYMSHEQAEGRSDIDARTDVWALGVVLYEMLSGVRPFEAPNANAVLAAIRRHAVKPLHEVASDVPASIAAVVDRCLSIERASRFDDGDAFALALEEAALRSSDPPKQAAARSRSKFVVAIVPLVIVCLVALYALLPAREEGDSSAEIRLSTSVNDARTEQPDLVDAGDFGSTTSVVVPVVDAPLTTTLPTSNVSAPKRPVLKRRNSPITRVDEVGF